MKNRIFMALNDFFKTRRSFNQKLWCFIPVIFCLCFSEYAWAAGDPKLEAVLFGFISILLFSKMFAFIARKWKQPVVLGELLAGIVMGNLAWFGIHTFEFIPNSEVFQMMAGLGAVFMLFEVGLESDLKTMLGVGKNALLVALGGIIIPSTLGVVINYWMNPHKPLEAHLFTGAVLAATSIGITARVLKELGKVNSEEGKIILGAAVLDDVLGLILLAAVSGMVAQAATGAGGGIDLLGLSWVSFKAIGFLGIALFVGIRVAPILFKYGAYLRGEGALFLISILVCFVMAYLASLAGLAPIIGAFAAGLLIDGTGFEKYFDYDHHNQPLESALFPISRFLSPVFFVLMGCQVQLSKLMDFNVIILGGALTLAAIVGKIACGYVIPSGKLNRLAIGFGMVPRAEVGLIFAAIGLKLQINGDPVISPALYAAIVMMVMITTIVAPPGLNFAFALSSKSKKRKK